MNSLGAGSGERLSLFGGKIGVDALNSSWSEFKLVFWLYGW